MITGAGGSLNMLYALVTSVAVSENINPGSHIITAGIRHWLRQQDHEATFITVNMLAPDPQGWQRAKHADKIVFCGNPRFNETEKTTYWDWDVWTNILATGKPFIDAWAGSAVAFQKAYNHENVAARLAKVEKNKRILEMQSKAECVIARDEATALLTGGMLLPCSSYYAATEYGVRPQIRTTNAITVRNMPGDEWLLDVWAKLKARLEPCLIIAHSIHDYRFAERLKPMLISDPLELLKVYATVKKLHSFRLHASIPACSLGCKVTNYYTDYRGQTCNAFPAINNVPFTTLHTYTD